MTHDYARLAAQYNGAARPANAAHMVSVAQLREALDAWPDDMLIILPHDDDESTPLAREDDGKVSLLPCWYNARDCTWAGETANLDPHPGEDPYEPEVGADVLVLEMVGVH